MNISPSLIKENKKDSSNKFENFLQKIAKNLVYTNVVLKNVDSVNTELKDYLDLRKTNIKNKQENFLKKESKTEQIKKTAKIIRKTKKEESKSFINKIFDISSLISLPLFIGTALWKSINTAWDEYKESGSIWEAFKSGIGELVNIFTFGFLDKKKVDEFMGNDANSFYKNFINSAVDFVFNLVDWFKDKLGTVSSFREKIVLTEPKDITNKKKKINDIQLKRNDSEIYTDQFESMQAEIRRLEAEQTALVKRLESEKQYSGEDEIVRQRMGLPPKTETMKREESERQTGAKRTYFQKESAATTAGRQYKPSVPAPTGDDRWIMQMIKNHEGVRNIPYKDSRGLWTVGVGHLIGDGRTLPPEYNRQFSSSEIDFMFAKDYEKHKKMAEKAPGYDLANEKGKAALIDLTFNMGGGWFKNFKNAASALAKGNFELAAEELTDSLWYKQVKGRAATIVSMIRDGLGVSPSQLPQISESKIATTPIQIDATSTTSTIPGSLSSLVSVQSGVDISGLNPEFSKRLSEMAADFKDKTGEKLKITSGFRSNEKQKQLWDAKVAQLGGNESAARKWVAEPAAPLGSGRGSYHSKGLAIDVDKTSINKLAGSAISPTGWLESFGLSRPVKNEDWHIQPTGLTPTPDNPLNPGASIEVAGKDNTSVNLVTGKRESIISTPKYEGTKIAATSSEIACDQRKQQKSSTPMIINAPTNNTQIVTNSKSTSTKQLDIVNMMITRIA